MGPGRSLSREALAENRGKSCLSSRVSGGLRSGAKPLASSNQRAPLLLPVGELIQLKPSAVPPGR